MPLPTKTTIASASSTPVAAGAFTDDEGVLVANGYLVLTPTFQSGTLIGGGIVSSTPVRITLDANGVPTAGQSFYSSNQFLSPVNPSFKVLVKNVTDSIVGDLGSCVISGSSPIDLTTLTAVSAVASFPNPILSTPPGDQTISSGNLTLAAGNLSVVGSISGKTIEQVRFADQFSGTDIVDQIRSAIADLPAQGGTVDARAFNTAAVFTCTSGALVIGSATKPVKLILPSTIIINNAATVAFNLVNGAIIGDGTNGIGSRLQNNTASADTLQINGSRNSVQNVTCVRGVASSGAAVHLIGSGTTPCNHNYLSNVRADCTSSTSGSIGFQFTGANATALCAENVLAQCFTDECDIDFQFDTTGTQGPTDNHVFGYHIVNTSGGTVGIKMSGTGTALNQFYGGIIPSKTTGISIASGVSYTKFFGPRLESNTTNISNAGTGTEFYGLSVDAATITDTDTASTYMGTGNASFTQKINGANIPRRLDTQFLLAPVTGTGSFATLFTTSIPANTLGKNGCLRVHFAYLHSTGTAGVSYKITLGATTLQGAWTDAGTSQANSSVTICNRGATNSQGAWSLAVFDGTTTISGPGVAAASEDTTATLNLSLQFNVANTDAVTPRAWIVELI